MKKISYAWIVLPGLLIPLIILAMFSQLIDPSSLNWLAYVVMFLAGAVGGAILIAFLNRAPSAVARWVILAAFLLASPFAILLMLFGSGKIGPVGVILFPIFPWALLAWLGSLLGNFIARKGG